MLRSMLVLCALLGSANCATVLSGSTQTLTINSNAPGAVVSINGSPVGRTPLVIEVERKQTATVRIDMPGYRPFQAVLNSKVNPYLWINIVGLTTVGSSTDFSTGAMHQYEPDTVYATLYPMQMNRQQREQWQRRAQVRVFVLLHNEALVAELARGRGEHLDSLVGLSGQERAQAIRRWRAAYRSSETTLAFADAIAGELPGPKEM